jgi:short-subunit dehydrogenase
MKKTLLVLGHGVGISDAVARKFAREGFAVGLVARSADKLEAAAARLRAEGHTAVALPCDLADAAAVKALVAKAKAELGPITAIHHNAYGGGAGDLLGGDLDGLRRAIDVSVTSLVTAVSEARADLVAAKGAVLVTGGAFCFYDPQVDAMATQFHAQGLAVAKAAQHKAVGLLAAKLGPEGVYVGEVVVAGMVKGTAFDHGNATLDANDIAAKFFDLYAARAPESVTFG